MTPIRTAQVLLLIAAGALWVASRLPWVIVHTFDGLGPPKTVTLSGASWSTALLPLAVLLLAAVVAAVAVRGWLLRVLAVLVAALSLAIGYLAVSLWVIPDVAVRGVGLVDVPVLSLVGTERRYWGALAALVAAVATLIASALLIRAVALSRASGFTRYVTPAVRRARIRGNAGGQATGGAIESPMSPRMLWDALDEGHDPTDQPDPPARQQDCPLPEANTEGR
ncbi:MAG: TIGR02234 family membrane protein [Mycobacteriaceae bacterium]|nr:TIGR02234 family membrane protein [Mycobacteriaceae bacterium]